MSNFIIYNFLFEATICLPYEGEENLKSADEMGQSINEFISDEIAMQNGACAISILKAGRSLPPC